MCVLVLVLYNNW